mmetsp:Transcript_39544/g.99389  ORF Transcript_39544/g.99389 Transcript_39544/m.99389 type:complete len:307 (+) Transcript_39544:327-1247(+)
MAEERCRRLPWMYPGCEDHHRAPGAIWEYWTQTCQRIALPLIHPLARLLCRRQACLRGVAYSEDVHSPHLWSPAQQLAAAEGQRHAVIAGELALQVGVRVGVGIRKLVLVVGLVKNKHKRQHVAVLVLGGPVVEDALGRQPLPGRPARAAHDGRHAVTVQTLCLAKVDHADDGTLPRRGVVDSEPEPQAVAWRHAVMSQRHLILCQVGGGFHALHIAALVVSMKHKVTARQQLLRLSCPNGAFRTLASLTLCVLALAKALWRQPGRVIIAIIVAVIVRVTPAVAIRALLCGVIVHAIAMAGTCPCT